jgi:hypothetical protein
MDMAGPSNSFTEILKKNIWVWRHQGLVISQFETEIDEWKKILTFIQVENINLKERLTLFLKHSGDNLPGLMERAEYFHDLLLKEDEITSFLNREIMTQQKLLQRDIAAGNENLVKQTGWLQVKLGNMVLNAAQRCSRLKIEFNNCVEDIAACHVTPVLQRM